MLLAAVFSQAQSADPAVRAGALTKNGVWEVGVTFNELVTRNSAIVSENYAIAGAEIQGLRYVELNNAVVLTVSGLATNSNYSLSVTNLRTEDGTPISGSAPFLAKGFSWAAIGAQELGFPPDAVAVGDNGFDLVSGGVQMRADYDESTFAFEQITGNFDRKVRVVMQEPSSPEARAGLMVREALDEGKTRPIDPESVEEAFSRYIQLHVTPATTVYTDEGGQPVPGANQHEAMARLYTGGINNPSFETTDPLTIVSNTAPAYPNAWLRVRRNGQTFTLFRGEDGTNWVRLGSYTFPTDDVRGPLSNTVYVGPNFSPETGNIPASANSRRAFLAQFRDYGLAEGNEPSEPPTLRIVQVGAEVEISWDGGGTLQTSSTLAPGSWTAVPNAVSPHRTAVAGQHHRFYRVEL